MNAEQAINLLAQVAGKAVMPLEVYPQVQQTLSILQDAITKPVVETNPEL